MARLLLLRHGQSTWNAEHRWQGWADPPLSALGEEQAGTAGRWLRQREGPAFAGVACSDLRRARRTAEIMADRLGVGEPLVEAALRERDVGDWSGLTTTEIEAGWPEVLADWRSGRIETTPGGEPAAAFLARMVAGVTAVAAWPAAATGPVVVITHGGGVRTLERALGRPPCAVANLCGRWIDVVDGELHAGDEVVIPGLSGPAVPAAL